jgi:hypothetical protein
VKEQSFCGELVYARGRSAAKNTSSIAAKFTPAEIVG